MSAPPPTPHDDDAARRASPAVVDPEAGPAPGDGYVRALATGLAVLRAFTPDTPTLSLTEAAQAAGVTRATARRMLLTLTELGYAVQDGRRFELTPRVLELGHGYWSGRSVSEILRPILTQASQRLHQSCSAGVLHGTHLMYIARVHTERILRVNLDVGTRLPAFTTSMGRVLLADLPEDEARALLAGAPRTPATEHTLTDVDALLAELAHVREQGHAVVTAELDAHLSSVAVPVRDADGRVAVAINTALSLGPDHRDPAVRRRALRTGRRVPAPRTPEAEAAVAQALPVLRAAADDAEAALAAFRR